MSRQTYSYMAPKSSRNITAHGTSRALKSSTNQDEDWTKISDLAERRRIQNRIAQRNYRKKLKRRLEDLERRAGPSSASPPQVHAELYQLHPHRQLRTIQSPPRLLHNQEYTPPMQPGEELMCGPVFNWKYLANTYPAPESMSYQSYPQSQTYRPVSTGAEYIKPVTLPAMMHFHEPIKWENDYTIPFNLSYQELPAVDIQGPQDYEDYKSPLYSPKKSTSISECLLIQ